MKSFYQRQFLLMAGMVLTSFALLSSAFITLSYQYTIQDKRDSMERNAEFIADFTAAVQSSGLSLMDSSYQAYVSSISRISDAYVIICQPNGRVILASEGTFRDGVAAPTVPEAICKELEATGDYSGMTTLEGLFNESRYVAGRSVTLSDFSGKTYETNLVFVAADTSSITELWRAVASIFFFTALCVVFIAFICSALTSRRQTRPMHEIAEMARKFGHGEMDARVTGYEDRQDEVGELAEAFNTMAESLAQSEARRTEFISNISHELKTPMTTIAGFADGILDGTIPPEKEKEYLKTISSETRRLSRLVRRMLDLSRLRSSQNVTAQETFDIVELMLRVLVSLEPRATARHLDVETHLPDGSVMVWGDPDAITQVCYNLLDNAVKFASEGSTIGIAIAAKAGKARVSVRNSGETIPPEELSLLFDRFHKSDRSRSMDRDGVGLGLYIVKTILGNHKENITVTSENGITEFTFTLTLA